ncbi:MAG: orotidine-5'-phosphate decarboxylase [Pirellulales bacterium]
MTHFTDRLAQRVLACKTPALVGLDPRLEQLPAPIRPSAGANASLEDQANAYQVFCEGIIDVVAGLVPAVKPQAAFFEQLGPLGMVALGNVINYAKQKGLLVVLDGKRNDIGSTATAYAKGMLGPDSPWGADSLTVSPYLGDDSLQPFIDVCNDTDSGIYVLVKTSNPGGKMLQDLEANGKTLYRHVADYVEQASLATKGEHGYGVVGAVVGATYPEQLSELRTAMPSTWFLVPGFGSQGGGAADVAGAFDERGLGAIINNSRGIIFAHAKAPYAEKYGDTRWQEAVEAATLEMIQQLKDGTSAGNL